MLNNKNELLTNLRRLGPANDECKVYLALLETSMSHLEVARKTGVNRTKVYRIADDLTKRSLITQETSDRGRELTANDPANLEVSIVTEEERLKLQRDLLSNSLPELKAIYTNNRVPTDAGFVVNTYDGIDGFKQMLWNELKTEGEVLIFGSGPMEKLVDSRRWSERHRARTVELGYKVREILNLDGEPNMFTDNDEFMNSAYARRYIDPEFLPLGHQMCIYNNTVALYNWRNNQKVGAEIINKPFADMQRAIFENYWKIAKEVTAA